MKKTLIERIEVGSGGAASIEFTSIPQTYAGLYLVLSTRQESATNATVFVNPNGLTTNQSFRYLEGNGSVAGSSTETRIKPLDNPSGATANTFASSSIYIPNYAGSNYKSFSIDSLTENNSTTAYQRIAAALWSVTDAITSLEIIESSGDIAQYSSASLYGVTSGSDGTTTVS